jgi:hypothetical protein
MKKELNEVSDAELLAFVLSGGCDGDPGVTDKSSTAYATGHQKEK